MDDPDVFEKEFMKYLKEQGYEIDDTIMEEVVGSVRYCLKESTH